jgi:hypothetical protein
MTFPFFQYANLPEWQKSEHGDFGFYQINTDLVLIFNWPTRNGLCLNSQKTKVNSMAIYPHDPSTPLYLFPPK